MIVVPSTLEAVTIYAEGALCTRLASVPRGPESLPRQVRIEGLPLSLRPGSLRARVLQGPPGLNVRDVRPVFEVRLPPEADLPATQRALEEAQERLATLSAELERVQRDLHSLRQLRPVFPPPSPDKPQPPRDAVPAAVLGLADFVDSELAALCTRQLDLERQQRDAAAEVELRRRRLEEGSSAVRGQRAQLHRAAVITLSDAGAAEPSLQLALEYAVPGARWVPGYDLRLPRTLEGGALRMRASVLQCTGEDWSQVRVSLSTARWERRAEAPELKALRIGRAQPPPARSGWRDPPPGLDELFASYDSAKPLASPAEAPPPERTHAREFAMPAPAAPPPPPRPSAIPEAPSMSFGRGGAPGGGGPPLAPSMAAPMQSLAAPAPMPRKAAAPEMKRRYVRRDLDDQGREEEGGAYDMAATLEETAPELADEELDTVPLRVGGALSTGRARSEPRPPPRWEPEEELLDYGSLALSGADDLGARGRLSPHREMLSREQLLVLGMHVHVDVFALVAQAERTAETVREVALPTWCVSPEDSTPHFDYRFDVPTRVDVPSDGHWHTLPVFSAPVGLSAEYVCVPSVEPRVFRTVRVENRTPHALLAGPVDVTLGDEFLMTSPLPTLAPGATQRLGLGVEEAIKVSRNTRYDELSGGMFNNVHTLMHQVRVELANRTSQRVTVEVLERLPAVPAAEKDIKVEEGEVKPTWSRRELLPGETPVEGERAWRVLLPPGDTQKLTATWTVRIPANKTLVGGNRRT